MSEVKCNNCYNCEGFIPKSTKPPYNAFDYISGNVIGVCNNTEDVEPLNRAITSCDMWEEIRIK